MRSTLARWWLASADLVGAFIEELIFRVVLAWAVLRGKSPKPVEKRWWNRATETPLLINVWDWTNDRHIFSVLVWPALEVPPSKQTPDKALRERAERVMRVLHAGAAEMAWSTRYEVDYGLRWDPNRQAWVGTDGFAYPTPEWGERGGAA